MNENKHPEADMLDATEILALGILSHLASCGQLTRSMLADDGHQGLYWLMHDISKGIRLTMPAVDMVEIGRLHSGKEVI